MELCEMKCEDKIYMEKLLNNDILKTGDLILFKSTDNLHSFKLGNYFTHVGMVIVDEILTNNKPYIFEACNTKYSEIPHDIEDEWNLKYSKGILFHPVDERLKRYRGYLYYKPLSESITIKMHLKLINFIFYALNNMEYNKKTIEFTLRKLITHEKCNNLTNCAEIIFLSLIHSNLIDNSLWNNNILHYLKWVCNLKRLKNSYKYNPIVEIVKITI